MTVHACMYIHNIYMCMCIACTSLYVCMCACTFAFTHCKYVFYIKTVFVKIRSKCTYVNLHVSLIEHSTRHYLSYARCYMTLMSRES